MHRLFIFATVLLGIMYARSYGQTTVPGGDATGLWGINGSPYLVEGNLTIPDDSTLTIEPGVIVEFQGYYSIQVQGRLLAVGNESDSILFTVKDTTGFSVPDTTLGGWNGIRLVDTPLDNDSSKIVHCCLQYSKAVGPVWHLNAGGAISVLQFGKVLIADCLFRNNSAGSQSDDPSIGGAIYLFKSNALVRNNVFMNNRAHLGGAVYMDDSNPVFNGNLIIGNHADKGAGISIGGTSYPTFTDDMISNNTAENYGGGLLFYEPSVVTCNNLIFSGNKAVWGGAIGVMGGELQADHCLIEQNSAQLWGGGVAGDFATFGFNHCSFTGDSSGWGSGGLHMDHAVAEIDNCSFTENKAVFGGGFHAVFSQVESHDNQFIANQTEGGGGVHLENSDCLMDHCMFESNQALNGTGGAIDYWADSAIFAKKYDLRVSRCMISENNSTIHSGAVRIEQDLSDSSLVEVVVDSCRFARNHSDVYGSFRIGGPINGFRVSNCIFEGNTSDRYVAGPGFISNSKGIVYNCVFNSNYSRYSDSSKNAHGASLGSEAEVDFINCTFVDTSYSGGVGLSVRRGGKANVLNSIFWGTGNQPISVATAAELGSTLSVNYCNIENGIDSIYVSDSLSVLLFGDGNMAEDPLFADMQHGDLHLTDSSPCIGTGIKSMLISGQLLQAPQRDIEGFKRPGPQDSQPDMGAYENPLGGPVATGPFTTLIGGGHPLLRAYPNPFREFTFITYQLSGSSSVELSIYDLSGQKLETLVSGNMPAGIYMVEWNAHKYPAGIYLCRFIANRQSVQTTRLLLLK